MDRPLQDKYDKLKRHHDSLVAAIETLNASLAHLHTENNILKAQALNADKFVDIQKKIVIDNLNQSKEIQDNLVKEIVGLKKNIKALRER